MSTVPARSAAPPAPAAAGTAAPASRLDDPIWKATAAAALAQLAGLALILIWDAQAVLALAATVAGAGIAAFVLAPRAAAAVRDHPGLLVAAGFAGVAALWLALRLSTPGVHGLGSAFGIEAIWSAGDAGIFPLAIMPVAATGGLVLIADAVRVRQRRERAAQAPWEQLVAAARQRRELPWRAIAGVLLIGWAAVLAIGLAGPYVSDSGLQQIVVLLVVAGAAGILIGTPLLVATLTRATRDEAHDAVEDERQRFAAHLHDSVLQTLALVQRQAHDPAAVVRLARRQEHALRAWMAGETELLSDTLVAALRDVVADVEDEQRITIELTALGDRRLDAGGEALVAAAREALRNAARHAGGAAIVVFAEITPGGVAVFVRDEGAGFDPAAVAPERRGIRDAIIGRMTVAGGHGTVESAPGEGTEVALRLGESAQAGRAGR